jgi:hypothetical protein
MNLKMYNTLLSGVPRNGSFALKWRSHLQTSVQRHVRAAQPRLEQHVIRHCVEFHQVTYPPMKGQLRVIVD